MLKKILSLMIVLLPCAMAGAQVVAAARGGALGNGLRVGGEFSGFAPDFSNQHLYGIGVYVDYDVKKWIGAEVNARFLQFNGYKVPGAPGTLGQNTYGFGPRLIYNRSRFALFAKPMFGIATTTFPDPILPSYTSDSYFYYSMGGGLDYKLNRRIALRAEYEQQFWQSFAVEGASGTLTPHGFSFGASYRIF
jgi:opacity protein-like surface antigen